MILNFRKFINLLLNESITNIKNLYGWKITYIHDNNHDLGFKQLV